MTDSKDIIARADAALEGVTDGSWSARRWNRTGEIWPDNRWSVGEENSGYAICISPRYADQDDLVDARFIAASRQLVPELRDALAAERARVEALEAENKRLGDALGWCAKGSLTTIEKGILARAALEGKPKK